MADDHARSPVTPVNGGKGPGSHVRPVTRSTIGEHVYQELRQAIWTSRLRPGERLVIDQLARQLGVSITPVRDALRRLQLEGLVTETPYRGASVSRASAAEVRELFEIRGVLEGYVLARGVEAFSPTLLEELRSSIADGLQSAVDAGDFPAFHLHNVAFHERMIEIATTGRIRAALFDVLGNISQYRLLDVPLDRTYMNRSQEQHRELVRLLEDRDRQRIEELSREHSLNYLDSLGRLGGFDGERPS